MEKLAYILGVQHALEKLGGPRWDAVRRAGESYKMWKPKLFGALTGGMAGGAAGAVIVPGIGAVPGAVAGMLGGAMAGRAVGGAGRSIRAVGAGLKKPPKV